MKKPFVSIIIPSKNRPTSLKKAVSSILNQREKRIEIIIVDQSLHRQSLKNIKPKNKTKIKTRIIYLYKPGLSGLTAARNYGIKHSKGEIIQFMDDDSELATNYIKKIKSLFKNNTIDAVAGKVVEKNSRIHPLAKYFFKFFFLGEFRQIREEWYNKKNAAEIITNTLPGIAAYRKKVFRKYKFDEKMTGNCIGEDLEFSFRAGKEHTFILSPKIKMIHTPDKNERLNDEGQAYRKVRFYRYHFKKNIDKTLANYLFFTWLNIGFLCHYLLDFKCDRPRGLLRAWFQKK